MAEQGLDHVKVDAGPNPVRGRGMAQHVRPDGEPASSREPLEPALRGPVGHRRADRLMVEVDHDHLSPVLAGQPGPLMPVAGVSGEHRVAGRHGPRETGLRQRAVRVSPVPHVHMSPHHRAAQRACVRQQVHVRPAQPQRLTDPQAFSRSRRRTTRNWSRGRRQHASTASACSSVSASGNGVCTRALSARERTVRNWPDSPASNPGGVNRSHRGSDSCSATAMSISPVRAQNRRNSHTAVSVALTVAPERSRPPRPGVTSMKCLKRASDARLTEDQSTPCPAHQPRKLATRPA